MKRLQKSRCLIGLIGALSGAVTPHLLRADAPATQPAAAPATQPVDSPDAKDVRQAVVALDADESKMSLQDVRKTFHTESDEEARYADYLAHEAWEAGKTEQAVRDKWGVDADTQFCRATGGTTREEDQVCQIKVDGNHAVLSWDIKDSQPQKMIKVDGKWLEDVHAMWLELTKDDPKAQPDQQLLGPVMKQLRTNIADGKYEDADAFIADLKLKLAPSDGN